MEAPQRLTLLLVAPSVSTLGRSESAKLRLEVYLTRRKRRPLREILKNHQPPPSISLEYSSSGRSVFHLILVIISFCLQSYLILMDVEYLTYLLRYNNNQVFFNLKFHTNTPNFSSLHQPDASFSIICCWLDA